MVDDGDQVDDRVHALHGPLERDWVGHVADGRLYVSRPCALRRRRVAHQRPHLVTARLQPRHQVASHEARRTGHQDHLCLTPMAIRSGRCIGSPAA